jgi:hypothetical protein
MPCRDWSDDNSKRVEYINGVDPTPLNNRNNELEAMLCAIFNELEARDIADEVIGEAEKNGMVVISDFWKEHQKEDRERLGKKIINFLSKFSDHEQRVILELMKNRKDNLDNS